MAYTSFLKSSRGRVVDDLLILKAKGTVATSMIGENPVGTDTYVDVGNGRTQGSFVCNVYSCPTILATSKFTMRLQGSLNSSFSTINDLVILELGDATQISGGSDLTEGRYIVPFCNTLDGTSYRYLRHYATLASVGGGMQYECYLSDLV